MSEVQGKVWLNEFLSVAKIPVVYFHPLKLGLQGGAMQAQACCGASRAAQGVATLFYRAGHVLTLDLLKRTLCRTLSSG